jgi:predicted RND superfamily exporter protein
VAAHDAALPGDQSNSLNKTGDELWRITAHVASLSEVNYGELTQSLDGIAQETLKRHSGAGHVVTGTVPVFLRTQQAVLQSLIKSFVISLIVIGIMLSFVLKNPVSGLLALLPNAIPMGFVFGVLSWCGWSVDVGTMVTASVALGIAVDGTLHLLTWFRNGIEEGLPRRDACLYALEKCAPAIWQTSLVISLGLLMLVSADLLLISRFGLLMAALIGTAFVANVVLMPLLLDGVLGRLIQSTLTPPRAAGPVPPRPVRPVEISATAAPESAPALQPHLKVVAPTSTKPGRKLRID